MEPHPQDRNIANACDPHCHKLPISVVI
jgi:hypothetical protein